MGEKSEIELRAVLSEDDYNRLYHKLSQNLKILKEETLNTINFVTPDKKGDIRLRFSDKRFELVHKEGHATKLSRNEITIRLKDKEAIDNFEKLFKILNFEQHPSWITHKKEFEYNFNGFDYIICLQHIENFAHLLEIEIISEDSESQMHAKNIKNIMNKLECEPVDSEEFKQMIRKYHEENKVDNGIHR